MPDRCVSSAYDHGIEPSQQPFSAWAQWLAFGGFGREDVAAGQLDQVSGEDRLRVVAGQGIGTCRQRRPYSVTAASAAPAASAAWCGQCGPDLPAGGDLATVPERRLQVVVG